MTELKDMLANYVPSVLKRPVLDNQVTTEEQYEIALLDLLKTSFDSPQLSHIVPLSTNYSVSNSLTITGLLSRPSAVRPVFAHSSATVGQHRGLVGANEHHKLRFDAKWTSHIVFLCGAKARQYFTGVSSTTPTTTTTTATASQLIPISATIDTSNGNNTYNNSSGTVYNGYPPSFLFGSTSTNDNDITSI